MKIEDYIEEYKDPYEGYDIFEVKVTEMVEGVVRVYAKDVYEAMRYLEQEVSRYDIIKEMSKDAWKLKIEKPYEDDCISTCETWHFDARE